MFLAMLSLIEVLNFSQRSSFVGSLDIISHSNEHTTSSSVAIFSVENIVAGDRWIKAYFI